MKKAAAKNWVAEAVRKVGGRKKAALLCGVATNTVHYWIRFQRIRNLRDALKLSEASGIPIKRFSNGVSSGKNGGD